MKQSHVSNEGRIRTPLVGKTVPQLKGRVSLLQLAESDQPS